MTDLRTAVLAQEQAWFCPESPEHRYKKPGHCEACGKTLVLAQQAEQKPCSTDPRAPHGFDRTASHTAGRYVCECEHWQAEHFCDTHCTWADHAPGCVRAEPVGTVRVDAGEVHIVPLVRDADRSALKDGQSVYTAPPQRKFVPLTVEEIERIWRDGGGVGRPSIGLIRAIEQALKEQNR